ncbi:MAG: metallophosphoesterase [Candidatus Nanohaloarchaea archaeon]
MKILVVGDCHGKMPSIPDQEFDLILCVGDICGGTEEMRSVMMDAIEDERQWHEIVGEENARQMVQESIKEGREILERLDELGVPVLVVPGNWDWTGENSEWEFLEARGYPGMLKGMENIVDLNLSSFKKSGYNFVGYGPCPSPELPQYEQDFPGEEELEELRREYRQNKQKLAELLEESGNTVLLSHNVPNDTSLDRIEDEDNPEYGKHFGSIIVRELVENYQPEYCIAGHMHEGEGKERLGKTLCLNTGLETVWNLDTETGELKKI